MFAGMFFILGIIFIIWEQVNRRKMQSCKNTLNEYILLYDSLAQVKPDSTFVFDTVYPEPETVRIVKKIPTSIKQDDTTYYYKDSLNARYFTVYLDDIVSNKGILKNRYWRYSSHCPELIKQTITVTEPYPVIKTIPQEKDVSGFYWMVGAGKGTNTYGYSFEVDYMTARGWMFGLQGLSMNNNYIFLKAGKKF